MFKTIFENDFEILDWKSIILGVFELFMFSGVYL